MKNLSILLLAIIFISCDKNEKEDATINYYLTTTSETAFDEISFQFEYTRAYRQQKNEIRTIYLDPIQVEFDLNSPTEVFLGSSKIEPVSIDGYDFGFSQFDVVIGADTLALNPLSGFDNYADFPSTPSEGGEIDITFTLDVDASIVLDSAGQNWIRPLITIEN